MDGSIDVVKVGQMEHLYSGSKSRVGAQNHEGRALRGLKMILPLGAKTHRKMAHGAAKKDLPHWVDEFMDKIRQEILILVRKPGYDASYE
jgi:hypothetical protein